MKTEVCLTTNLIHYNIQFAFFVLHTDWILRDTSCILCNQRQESEDYVEASSLKPGSFHTAWTECRLFQLETLFEQQV